MAPSLAVVPGGLQGFGAPHTCSYSLSSPFWVMQVTESIAGPALSGFFFFPVGKALPGFCHSSVSFLSSQNISKLLYAVTQQLDSALVLSWFSQVETLLTNVGVCKSLTPADCVGVIKCMENMFNPTWSSLSLSQFASRLSWNTAPFCPLCFLISFLCCCLAVKYYVLQ